ncbi:MAG TPA: hypothetical protein VH268_00440 [Solirubrobacterales bacterium]|nr:hypothetical protein [Solirubrobacterales bacterium]
MGEDENPLRRRVYVGGAYREFGGVTAADARAQAAELADAGSWGPLAKVAGVAQAWRELAAELERLGEGSTVAALDPETGARYARRLWVEPPRGSLL